MIARLRPAPIFLTLALAVAGAGEASADRYSRDECKQLKVEYADALTTGARSDMEQGPDWAQSNLNRYRLENVQRLIDLEAELEFRCSLSRRRIADIKPERKPVIPEVPEQKELPDPPSQTAKAEIEAPPAAKAPETKTSDKKAPDRLMPDKQSPAANAPAANPAATKSTTIAKGETAAIEPQSAAGSVAKSQAPAAKPPAKPSANSAQPPANATQPPAKVATQQAKKPSRPKKNSSGNGYVSPREVAPFSLYRNGASW